jgi:hypothetical protein
VISPASLSISAVSRRTGIPVSTLRFYERELPGLFHIRKTAGGHRRYAEARGAFYYGAPADGWRPGLAEVRRVLALGNAEALGRGREGARGGAADALAVRDLGVGSGLNPPRRGRGRPRGEVAAAAHLKAFAASCGNFWPGPRRAE